MFTPPARFRAIPHAVRTRRASDLRGTLDDRIGHCQTIVSAQARARIGAATSMIKPGRAVLDRLLHQTMLASRGQSILTPTPRYVHNPAVSRWLARRKASRLPACDGTPLSTFSIEWKRPFRAAKPAVQADCRPSQPPGHTVTAESNVPPLFTVLPAGIFSPLASPNRHHYWRLLTQLYRDRFGPDAPMPPSVGFQRREIVADLERYLLTDDPWEADDGDTPRRIHQHPRGGHL